MAFGRPLGLCGGKGVQPGPSDIVRPPMLPSIAEISENFDLLDDWEERYRYLIELGRLMPPLPDEAHNEANKVQGCASQVWLDTTVSPVADDAIIAFRGDSDAHIVKGLVALLVALLSGRSARDILKTEPLELFDRFGLADHLTPQRSNGLRSMVDRIRSEARRAVA